MAEPVFDPVGWQTRLAALHSDGAERLDPMGWHRLAALARRTQAAPADVQAVLVPKLQTVWADLAQRCAQPPGWRAAPAATTEPRPAPGPLAALTQHLHARAHAQTQAASPVGSGLMADGDPATDSPSVQRFRETWAHIATEHQVARAAARAPDNAGPLNSHMLVLRSLALMQDLSPDYLRRFVSHLDTLLWLEKTSPQAVSQPAVAKPRRSKAVKKKS
jgi:hypothetical protein